jgi:hypothetical protein
MKAHSIIQGKKVAVDNEGFQEPLKNVYPRKLRPLCRSELQNEAMQQIIWPTWNHSCILNDDYRLLASYSSTNFMIKALWTVTVQMNTNTGLTPRLLQPNGLNNCIEASFAENRSITVLIP